jgi:VanZ family protein
MFACMAVIFRFSSQDAERSTETSGGFIVVVARVFVRGFDDMPEPQQAQLIDSWQFFVRKNAHFFIYLTLGLLTMAAMFTHRVKLTWQILIAFAIVFLYAVSDEIHQIFVPGRSCLFSDVLIDTAGSSLGMLIVVGISTARTHLHNKKHENLKSVRC